MSFLEKCFQTLSKIVTPLVNTFDGIEFVNTALEKKNIALQTKIEIWKSKNGKEEEGETEGVAL